MFVLNIIVIGVSGHAKAVIDCIEKENKYEIIGLLDRFKEVGSSSFGYKIIGKEEDLQNLIKMHKIEGGIKQLEIILLDILFMIKFHKISLSLTLLK